MLRQTSNVYCRPSANAPAVGDTTPSPVSEFEFADLVARACPIPNAAPVAVAVSGGGDSMALAWLASGWGRRTNREIKAVTIDHCLRADSRAEAEAVGRWMAAVGISHDILTWSEEKPLASIQAHARAARYRLIGEWAKGYAIRHVFLGHQLEDQAETFLMRLSRGSRIGGLAAMRGLSERDGLRLCRPLLTVERARLRATLLAAGQAWIDDPSNESPRFSRTAYRRIVTDLETRGAGPQHLARLADAFARLDGLMEAAVRHFLGAAAVWEDDGSVRVDRGLYGSLPEPVAAAVLRRILAQIGGRVQAPRSDRLARARAQLTERSLQCAFTLGYCEIEAEADSIRFSPEIGRISRSFRGVPIAL